MNERPHFFDFSADQLADAITAWGMPRYRAAQVLDWVYGKGHCEPQQMTDLSRADRQTLAKCLRFTTGGIVNHQRASDGTQKLLIEWSCPSNTAHNDPSGLHVAEPGGGSETECVMIPAAAPGKKPRRTACISSQVGCGVGCRFCASGLGGLDANLTGGQIVEQVWQLGRLSPVSGQSGEPAGGATTPDAPLRISHVVFMGMGEPLANFAAVVSAIRTLTAPWAMGISARRITISTVGLPAQIRRLAEQDLAVTLAISLHAPNDQIRRELIPWAKYVSIDQLVAAGQYYFRRTGREVTLQYTLLAGVNDQPQHARELATVAQRLRSSINLIRYNEVMPLPFARPLDRDVYRFQAILRRTGLNVHIRASRGRDIAAACGQLRHDKNVETGARMPLRPDCRRRPQ